MALAGAILTTDMVPPDTWTSYTPSWTASTTDPTNFTASGYYAKMGNTYFVKALFTPGASFTAGSGSYRFGLPTATDGFLGLEQSIGTGILRDTSGPTRYHLIIMPSASGVSTVIPMYSATTGTLTAVTNSAPVAMTNGDYISMDVCFFA